MVHDHDVQGRTCPKCKGQDVACVRGHAFLVCQSCGFGPPGKHLIQFRDNGWTVQHPEHERDNGTLFGCPMAEWEGNDPGVRGVFVMLSSTMYVANEAAP